MLSDRSIDRRRSRVIVAVAVTPGVCGGLAIDDFGYQRDSERSDISDGRDDVTDNCIDEEAEISLQV